MYICAAHTKTKLLLTKQAWQLLKRSPTASTLELSALSLWGEWLYDSTVEYHTNRLSRKLFCVSDSRFTFSFAFSQLVRRPEFVWRCKTPEGSGEGVLSYAPESHSPTTTGREFTGRLPSHSISLNTRGPNRKHEIIQKGNILYTFVFFFRG